MATKKKTGEPDNPPARRPAEGPLRVRVKDGRIGYYGLQRRREGAVFTLKTPKHFSEEWMERVDASARETPAEVNGAQRALDAESEALRSGALGAPRSGEAI